MNILCRVGAHKNDRTMKVLPCGHLGFKVFFEDTCRRCGKFRTAKVYLSRSAK